jgi:hypothetical protein
MGDLTERQPHIRAFLQGDAPVLGDILTLAGGAA